MRTLQAMSRLQVDGLHDVELVVVNNASNDQTSDVIASAAKKFPFDLRRVDEPRQGLGFARNTGIAASMHSVILFTDDDCIPEPDWAESAARLLATNSLQVIGGRVGLWNPAHLPITIKTSLQHERLTIPSPLLAGFLHGANLAFGRDVVEKIGAFDERFGAGTSLMSAEDSEFAYRAFVAGIPVSYDPSFMVHHDHGRTGQHVERQLMRGYWIGQGAMAAKHALLGRIDLVRAVYWNHLSYVRRRAHQPRTWSDYELLACAASGAVRFGLRALRFAE